MKPYERLRGRSGQRQTPSGVKALRGVAWKHVFFFRFQEDLRELNTQVFLLRYPGSSFVSILNLRLRFT